MQTSSPTSARNRQSTTVHSLDDRQLDLPLPSRVNPVDVPLETIMRRRDFLGAINLCIELSGLADKEICLDLGIDPAQWSKIRKGEAHFPPNKLQRLMLICGNQVPLVWLARTHGYELVQIETETQRLLKEERAKREEVERENRLMRELLQGRG